MQYVGIIGVTTIKRIKAKTFWKSFAIYKIFKIINTNVREKKRLFLYYILFIAINFILFSLRSNGIAIILLIIFWVWTYYKMKKYVLQQEKIKQALKDICEGKKEVRIEEQELKGVLKEMAIYVNDIASGFSNAIAEKLKSERLKTELITNVSHDIKTPLTSIINYVDLLKKEKMPNEKATEYLMILDNKSQRLKKLTEDLVEASKASSGNIKLNMEKLNVKELVQQVSGEFEDRFKERNLEEITTFPEQDVYIKADGRYMCRILENIYSNVAKYAMENTRVYLDVVKNQHTVVIQMKNISKQELNISADELMQRFVRGETSRNTEGSGLGLSIASSLTELQGGQFHIYLDGDLFKVTIGFEILNN